MFIPIGFVNLTLWGNAVDELLNKTSYRITALLIKTQIQIIDLCEQSKKEISEELVQTQAMEAKVEMTRVESSQIPIFQNSVKTDAVRRYQEHDSRWNKV